MGLMDVLGGGLLSGASKAFEAVGGVFAPNSEAEAARRAEFQQAALGQFAAEFQHPRKGWFDRFMDGANRLPRPLMVVATFSLLATAMFDPLWFASRMQGLALVPDPLWWLMGAIVSFYFGGRWQVKGQEFRQSLAATASRVPVVLDNIRCIHNAMTPGEADHEVSSKGRDENAAISAWRAAQ
ncbi:MAG: carboxylesterase [Rhodobacterales bacterium]|nr:MAG: carboxylesterase [Rhodobacterales bacterium]